jgi:(S)-2-hydroxyglutarate dehydrogenase
VNALQRLVPALRAEDIRPGGAGVRAQAVTAEGALVDDFRIVQTADAVHVLNAPSPAATASLAIGRHIATIAAETFQIATRP